MCNTTLHSTAAIYACDVVLEKYREFFFVKKIQQPKYLNQNNGDFLQIDPNSCTNDFVSFTEFDEFTDFPLQLGKTTLL